MVFQIREKVKNSLVQSFNLFSTSSHAFEKSRLGYDLIGKKDKKKKNSTYRLKVFSFIMTSLDTKVSNIDTRNNFIKLIGKKPKGLGTKKTSIYYCRFILWEESKDYRCPQYIPKPSKLEAK